MAALPTTLTLEQFRELDLSEKPYLEFWFGEALRKPMGTFNHGLLHSLLVEILARYSLRTVSEVRIRLSGGADLVPDLIVTKRRPTGRYPTEPFELAVEIRSPEPVAAMVDEQSALLH